MRVYSDIRDRGSATRGGSRGLSAAEPGGETCAPEHQPGLQLKRTLGKVAAAGELIGATVELTHRCHLACTHCYLDDNQDHGKRRDELDTEEVKGLLTDLRAAGCLFVTLTGGEIFLRHDALELARHARSLSLAVTLYTTGTLLTEGRAREIADLHPWRVELSLYSMKAEVHDGITQRPGSHAATIRAVERLHELGVALAIKCPLMRDNFDCYDDLKAYAERLNIPFRTDVTVTATNEARLEPTDQRLSMSQLVSYFARAEIRQFAGVSRRIPAADERLCSIGTRSCLIGPFGDVYTCMGFTTPLGNIRRQPFAAIWRDSPTVRRVRALRAADLDICSSCEKFSYCNRCAGMALAEDGNFTGPSAWACHLAAAKEKAAGLPVTPSAAERHGLVRVVQRAGGFSLEELSDRRPGPSRDGASAACGGCCGCK